MNTNETREQNVLAQATILMMAGIVTRIIGVLYRSPVTSIIGAEGNGYYGFAVNIYTMVLLISSYSIPMAVSKVVSGKLALKQYKDAHRVFKCACIYVLIVGGIASLITFFGASVLLPETQSRAIPVLRVLAPTIFFSGFLGVLRGYFQAHGTMMPTSISQIVEQIINALVSIGAAILFIRLFAGGDPDKVPVFGAMGSAAGIGAGVIAGLLFMLILYMGNYRFFSKKVRKDRSGVESSYPEIFRIIFLMVTPVILSTFVYNINPVIDQTFFANMMSYKGFHSKVTAKLYGIFTTQYWTMINVPIALANSMSTAMIPAVSSNYTLKAYNKCNQHVKRAIHFTMMISIPAAAGIGVLARPIMELLFPQPDTIDTAVRLLQTGCVSILFYSLSTVSNGVLQGIGKVNVPLRNSALSLVAHIAVLTPLLFFTNLNLYALVFATMFYAFVMCLLNSIAVRKYLGYRQEWKKTFVLPIISSLIMGAFCYVFYTGINEILMMILAQYIPIRVIIMLSIALTVMFGAMVYFVLELKLKAVNEEELREFPKGRSLVSLAKRTGLL